ncbi:MAG: hypothetical protein ABI729_10230 [Chitinophagales bacterium]
MRLEFCAKLTEGFEEFKMFEGFEMFEESREFEGFEMLMTRRM